jgi:hypothetical protein
LGGILRRTTNDQPDNETLPKAIAIIKGFLSQVNLEAGNAKNRFDLENIHHYLSFKRKSDRLVSTVIVTPIGKLNPLSLSFSHIGLKVVGTG